MLLAEAVLHARGKGVPGLTEPVLGAGVIDLSPVAVVVGDGVFTSDRA